MSFDKAYRKTMGNEGGYSNSTLDSGGETYAGISRKWHPDWNGWEIVDKHKTLFPKDEFEDSLSRNVFLQDRVKSFYEREYWNKNKFDLIDEQSEEISEKLFDVAVNVGNVTACKWLQKAMNLLNRDGKVYRDISMDGVIGANTLDVFQDCLEHNPVKRILNVITVLQGSHYINIMERNRTQERWVGWFDRLDF